MSENLATTLLSLITAQYAVAVYCMPTLIALVRHHPDKGHISVINMYLGWTLVGWVWALVAAIRTPPTGQHTGAQHARGTEPDAQAGPEQAEHGGALTNRKGQP